MRPSPTMSGAARQLLQPRAITTSSGMAYRIHPRPAAIGRPHFHRNLATPLALHAARSFHSSSPSRAPRSPFQAFVDTLKEELKKSQELQENMRQLQGEAGKVRDSETMKKMREAYERARIITSIKENPRLQKAAEQLRKSGGQVGDAVGTALKQIEDSELIKGLGAISSSLSRQLAASTAPIRNTEAYKTFSETLTEAFDDGGSALRIDTGSADAREARRLRREARLRKIGRPPPTRDPEAAEQATETVEGAEEGADDLEAIRKAAAAGAEAGSKGAQAAAEEDAGQSSSPDGQPQATASKPSPSPSKRPAGYAQRVRAVQEDPEAGQDLVLRPNTDSQAKKAWDRFKERNPLARKISEMREAYDESENPVIERIRGITETIGGWFEENETAQVVGAFRLLDPQFTLADFQRDLREYILPEVIDAYHGAARHLLRQWCSEATYNVLMATIDPYLSKGMLANGKLMDMKNVDIIQGKMLDNNVAVLVVSFQTAELMYFRDSKTGEVKAGSDKQAEMCRYAVVMTRLEEELDNELSGGWKVVELARRGQGAFL